LLCASPVVYDRLSRGTYQFTVRATDAAGNIGEDQFTWTVRDPSAAAAPGRQQQNKRAFYVSCSLLSCFCT
jgi:hypothetical protein